MDALTVPALIDALAKAGESGLKRHSDSQFERELHLCRKWGFKITEAQDRIFLVFDQDQLVSLWIQDETPANAWSSMSLHGFLSIGSTNREALERAYRGAPHGTLIYAEEQTAGKGRRDRGWFSPAGAGLYFSLVVRPEQPLKCWTLLTHTAAIALFEALKAIKDRLASSRTLAADIKWPNDILLSGKKCAGILCETISLPGENHAAVVGVGIDVRRESVPKLPGFEAVCIDEILNTIVPRRKLLICFLDKFQKYYRVFEQGDHRRLIERWKDSSTMWNGVQIQIMDGRSSQTGVTCGLSKDGALLVRTESGAVKKIMAGDISIRRLNPNSA